MQDFFYLRDGLVGTSLCSFAHPTGWEQYALLVTPKLISPHHLTPYVDVPTSPLLENKL